uniref:CAS1 domain-containing protein 1-like n=1 Tax=Monopterus albus TaxID=43700 RepID=UPI0009B4966B|nr:CAS1 domain-containing protein 1-like [Monopterus albus]
MAVLAYSLGKRIINQHFTIKNAKLISLALVISLLVFHTASRYYGGGDSCEWLLSRGRYLGENVWQPYGCIMHKYKSNEAKTCLAEKRVAFVGDSRIRQLFYSFIKIIAPEQREEGIKVIMRTNTSDLRVFVKNVFIRGSKRCGTKHGEIAWTYKSMALQM